MCSPTEVNNKNKKKILVLNNTKNKQQHHAVISFCRRPRLLYCSTFCWMSLCGGRFLALFLEQSCHLTSTEIGMALAAQQIVSTLAGTAAGAWADARQRQNPCSGRAEVMAVGVISGTAFFVLHSIGWKVLDDESALWHVLLLAAFAVSSSLVFPVLDGLTIDFLKRNDDNSHIDSGNKSEDNYGKERLYGAISRAITHVATAPLLDLFGFARVLYPLTVLSCLFVLISLYIHVNHADSTDRPKQRYHQLQKRSSDGVEPDETTGLDQDADSDNNEYSERTVDMLVPPSSTGIVVQDAEEQEQRIQSQPSEQQQQQQQQEDRLSTRNLLQLLLSSRGGAAFFICLFCLSSGTILVESMVFLFFELLGSSYTIMGWTVVLTVVFEIPIFQIAPYLLKRLGGSHNMLLLACFCYTTRVIGYSLLPNGHIMYVFLLEPLHGVTYACCQMALVDFVVQSNLPVGYEASGQGLVQSFGGFGSTMGLLVGGWAEDAVGPRLLYRVAAGVVTVGAAVLGANQLLLARSSSASTMTMEKQSGHVPLQQQKQLQQEDSIELAESSDGSKFSSDEDFES